jgi:Tol biopolymer transport system component/DNA-binding winged helix-turn-helix (wHTH) protein
MLVVGKVYFGRFVFDLDQQRLSGPDGEIPLNLKSAAVLAYLVQRPGHISTKEELLQAVWTDTAVTDDALVQRVLDIRKALGDNSRTPQFIRTHPKRGYEFVAATAESAPDSTVPPLAAAPASASPHRNWIWPAAGSALLLLAALALWMTRPAPPTDLHIAQLTFLPGMEDYPVFGPSGRKILYASDEAGPANLWVLDEASGERKQVTQGAANLSEPDWSPDGDWIAYRSEEGMGGLYARSLSTGETIAIAAVGHHPRWSPDGQEIALHTAGAQAEIDIWSRRSRALRRINITGPPLVGISGPAWSADGKAIYFIANASTPRGAVDRPAEWVQLGHQIWRVSVAGGEARVVTPGTGILKDGGFDYDRRLSQLVFVGLDRGLWRSSIDASSGAETRKPARLTLTTQGHQHPRFGPHGEIVFSAIAAPEALWLAPFGPDGALDDTAMTRLTTGAASVRAPVLSPDGRRIAYFLWQGERFELWLLDLSTRAVHALGPNDRMSRTTPTWVDDGRGLAYDVMEGSTRERRTAWFTSDFAKLVDEHRVDDVPTQRPPRNLNPTGRFRPYIESRDGRQILMLDRKDAPPLQLSGPGHYQSPTWSADGKRLLYQSDEDGWFNIWALDFDPGRGAPAGAPRRISAFRGSPYMLSDSNLGFAVQPAGLVVPLRENRADLWMIRSR